MVWTPFTRKDHNRSDLRYPSDLSDHLPPFKFWRLI